MKPTSLNTIQSVDRQGTATLLRLKSGLQALALLCGLTASAQTSTVTTNFTDGRVIPDASASGLASTRMISTRITQMTDLNVTLKINGSFNGDLYAYLTHSSGRTVLLNRVGKRASNSLGYGDDGLDITFDDGAAGGDAHVYRFTINVGSHNPALPANTPLTGAWAPDGRTNSPLTVLDTDTRAALLNSFNGLNPNGEWVLFVADLESGDIHTLDTWGLEITGYTSPLITENPASLTKECSLENATFSVMANGSAPISYQWWKAGSAITDATNSMLTIPNVTFADAGNYDVIVSSPYGSMTSSVATLTVQDTTAPAVPTLATVTGECSATVTAPTTTDNCVGSVTGTTVDPLTYSSQGAFIVHWSFDDGNGNVSTANQTVIVDDVTAPAVPTLANATGECSATVTAPTTTDNCVGSVTGTTVDPLTYSSQGTFIVHWSFDDGNGNVSTANQTVIVDDVTAPAVPTLATVTGECSATVTAPTTTDNCVGSVLGTTVDPLTYNSQGTFIVHWSFDDGNGNVSTVNQTVIVDDVTAPTITCPANISVFTTNASGTEVSFALPSGADNCGVASVVASPASGSSFPVGTTPVVVTVTDIGGNTSQCTFNVTVVLNVAPVAGNDNMGAVQNHSCSVRIEKCGSNDFDLDDDVLTVIAVSASTNGGTVTFNSTHMTFTPATNYVGSDAFTYTISDGRGGVATATVTVEVYSQDAVTPNMLPIVMNGGIPTVRFAGIPGFTYTLERTPSLTAPVTWTNLGPIVVPASGIAEYPDTTAPEGSAFYRTASAELP